MTITLVALGNPGGPYSGAPATVPLPAGWAAGDLHVMIAREAYTSSVAVITPPAGWTYLTSTEAFDTASGGFTSKITVWTRTALAGDTAPSVSSTGNFSGTTRGAFVYIAGYRNSAGPLYVGGFAAGQRDSVGSAATWNGPVDPAHLGGLDITVAVASNGATPIFVNATNGWTSDTGSIGVIVTSLWLNHQTVTAAAIPPPPVTASSTAAYAAVSITLTADPPTPVAIVELGLTVATGLFTLGSSLLGGADVLGSGLTWTDVTEWVGPQTLGWGHGATRAQGPFWRAEAGTFSCTLNQSVSHDGVLARFDPLNVTGPYALSGFSQLRPGLPIRAQLAYADGSADVLFRGWVDTWVPELGDGTWSTVKVTATDGIERLQAPGPAAVDPVGEGDSTPGRLNRILDNIGWDGGRNIFDDGTAATLQATTMSAAPWSDMLLAADSDGGYLFISSPGDVTYLRRNQIATGTQHKFDSSGTVAGAYPVLPGVVFSYDREQIYNQIKLARAGGTEGYLEDDTSASPLLNGPRGYSRDDLICQDDGQVDIIAHWILFQCSNIRYRVEQVQVRLNAGDAMGKFSDLAGLDVCDTAAITYRAPSGGIYTQRSLVRGVRWQSLGTGSWLLTVALQNTPTAAGTSAFILGSSLLGGTDVLAPF